MVYPPPPPKYTPPTMHMPNENANHVVPVTFKGQQPQPIGGAREEPREHAQGDFDLYPTFTTKDRHLMLCLNPIP